MKLLIASADITGAPDLGGGTPSIDARAVHLSEAIAALEAPADALYLDLRGDPDSGFTVLDQVHGVFPVLAVVVRTEAGDAAAAARALESGAQDYVTTDDPEAIRAALAVATERKKLEGAAPSQAQHDRLTGLINAALFYDRLIHAMARSARENVHMGVLLVDIDHFKEVNHTHGYEVGDLMLRSIAQRMRQVLRKTDTVARLGGDRFGVVVEGARTPADVGIAAQKLLYGLRQPFVLEGTEIRAGASIGIAVYPLDARDPEHLMECAEAALARAADAGGAQFQMYAESTG